MKKELGRFCGCVSMAIEARNIVAGDLPFNSNGDFYLTIECGDNPPMSTSINENCNPKVVHFMEVLTLRVRDSPLEDCVRFVVKELNVFGSQELCELRLNATRVCDWTREGNELGSGIMRFQMTPIDASSDLDTPPWLALELAPAPEFRGRQEFTVHLYDTHTGVFESESSKTFKSKYKLLDRTGERQSEPEDIGEALERSRRHRKQGAYCLVFLVVLIIIAAVIFRLFLWKCWQEFTRLTIETGIPAPTHDDVMAVCDNPPNNARPKVFEKIAAEYNIQTLPCFKGVCHVRDQFVQYRVVFFTFMGILVLALLCLLARPPSIGNRKRRKPWENDDEAPRKSKPGKGQSRTLETAESTRH